MRAVTRTTLRLGDLLEIPVGIAAATGTEDVKFDTATTDGAARVQQFVHPDRTRVLFGIDGMDTAETAPEALERYRTTLEAVAKDSDTAAQSLMVDLTPANVPEVVTETVKGVRVGDTFRRVPPSELEHAEAATALDAVELLEFIDFRRVPTDRLTGSFWIQPDPGFARPLAVLMEAMRRDGKAMVVKWSVRSRQRVGVIRVRHTDQGNALLLNGAVFASQWREPDAKVLEPAKVEDIDERAVTAALAIIEAHHGTGSALEAAEDELPVKLKAVVGLAHDGIYDDPARTLELAARHRADGLDERADRLVQWAEERWPTIREKRDAVAQVIADGDDVGAKLAALVG